MVLASLSLSLLVLLLLLAINHCDFSNLLWMNNIPMYIRIGQLNLTSM